MAIRIKKIKPYIINMLPTMKKEAWTVDKIIQALPEELKEGTQETSKRRINRTLQSLVEEKIVSIADETEKSHRYYIKPSKKAKEELPTESTSPEEVTVEHVSIEFKQSPVVTKYLLKKNRTAVGYKKEALCDYIPNKNNLIDKETLSRLTALAQKLDVSTQATMQADTYTKRIAERLLIDLSYNSARLEGNTLSLLDTEKLLTTEDDPSYGTETERAMILNHKQAIEFVVQNIDTQGLSDITIKDIHYRLMEDILPGWRCGQIRGPNPAHKNDGLMITGSSYVPLENPNTIDNYIKLIPAKAKKIENPFEQSFFLLVHIAYLQAFVDGNKRTSRIASSIPLVRAKLAPNSFMDIEVEDYNQALMYFYETCDHKPFLKVFEYAYERSIERFSVVLDSIGAPDSFRIKYRKQRKNLQGKIIKELIINNKISPYIDEWMIRNKIEEKDFELFKIETLKDLKEINSARFSSIGVNQDEYDGWFVKQTEDLT
ncbi:MAG: hypothetical protein HOE90_02950 [Bacteriovoracaceae bacterium]|jgi:Fic family protein|nr:hypothetical protein [Bacteriovoracaceae bacterium]